MELFSSPNIWTSLINIMLVNIVLSGDNAVVIALAAHALPARQQRAAIVFGSAAAIAMRTILTIFAIKLLVLPYLKIVGGILLLYIAVKLMAHQPRTGKVNAGTTIGAAIRTILLADLVMSLDNVLGVAAASHGNLLLLIAGLLLSIPLIVFGSTFVLSIMKKFPVFIVLGAALLGYLGGEMLISDVAIHTWVAENLPNEQ
ncbi:MAG TPA: TerC family protein, partial [Burkholderiaceae bacterium]|nr:TerC family protein [Burkholderiaceae bacterium]